jgi:hypothetical protein
MTRGRWVRYVPDTVLIEFYGRIDRPWVFDEIKRRTQGEFMGRDARSYRELWDWQWVRLTDRLRLRIADVGASAAERRDTIGFLLVTCPDPQRAVDELLASLEDPDPRLRFTTQWGMKACRYELAEHRDRIIAALQPHFGIVVDGYGQDTARLCAEAFEALSGVPLPPRSRPGSGRSPDPSEVVSRLTGAQSDQLVAVLRELGIWPRILLWAYNGDSGPYRVVRHDLELDGKPGADCAIQISDPHLAHTYVLVFTRTGQGWTFAGSIDQANNTYTPATVHVDADHAGPVLVSRQDSGTRDQWWEFRFRVHRDRIERLSQSVVNKPTDPP